MSEYFQSLNYTLANEDTNFEMALLPKNAKAIASVNGSGSRSLPLMAYGPDLLWTIDISPQQLELSKLRLETIRALNHSEFLQFWGYHAQHHLERKKIFGNLNLTGDSRQYFTRIFTELDWQELLYQGKWEKTFQKLATVNKVLTGDSGAGLFECRTLEDQRDYFVSKFPMMRWNTVVALLGSATVFNALLYKGHFPKPNVSDNMFQFYLQSFRKLFLNTLARENFFLQLCFFGKIVHPEAIPCEGRSEIFAGVKNAIGKTTVEFKSGDLIETLSSAPTAFDFVSLSDVPSYFSGEREKNFLQEIKKSVQPGGLVVLRSYRHRPEGFSTAGYQDVTSQYSEQIRNERVGVYVIEIFKKL